MNLEIPSRRFGRTNIQIPILSLGGMRFQQSWTDLEIEDISRDSQLNLERTIRHSLNYGFHHLETARHYGSSETQLGVAMKNIDDSQRIIQTKIPPREDPQEFESELELSFQKLQCKRVDLLSIHGLNLPVHLDQTVRPGGCLDVVRRWQEKGLVGHVGFSTHAPTDLIVQAIKTNFFDYVNLHWYFIFQDNSPALNVAKEFDLGVFIISPTDKGGHLHTPSSKLLDLCSPLHPIVFNDLFCLRDSRVHTISVGASTPDDLQKHIEAIELLNSMDDFLPHIQKRLLDASKSALGEEWLATWYVGLPTWEQTPGQINIPVLLWLNNLLESWEMENFAKTRYRLLGNGSHWFPGANADALDEIVNEKDMRQALKESPWSNQILLILRKLKSRLSGAAIERLSTT